MVGVELRLTAKSQGLGCASAVPNLGTLLAVCAGDPCAKVCFAAGGHAEASPPDAAVNPCQPAVFNSMQKLCAVRVALTTT